MKNRINKKWKVMAIVSGVLIAIIAGGYALYIALVVRSVEEDKI